MRYELTSRPCGRCKSSQQVTLADLNIRRWMTECAECGFFVRTWEMSEGEAMLIEAERRVNQRV